MARKHPKFTPTRPSGERDGSPSVDMLVQQGLQAIEEYDYELARTMLTRAFESSGGAEAAARALFTLLVDHLAADHEALQLGERLSREALASTGIRLTLALAAARCGDSECAHVHLARLDGTAAADVLVVLAERAADTGDVDEAARLCDAARSRDGAHPGVRLLAHRIAQSREEERRPHETELERLLAGGRLDEAQHLAEQLLVRHPESAVARRVIRAALDRQRADEAERRVREVEGSLTTVDVSVARATFETARSAVLAASPDQRLAHRLAVVEKELAERELAANAGDVVRRLAEGEDRDGLMNYASQPSEVRARVREILRMESLDDLEHLLDRRSASEAIDALLAYNEAVGNAELHPQGALQSLVAHERALTGFGAASRLAGRIRQRLRDDRRRELLGRLAAARAAFDGGDPAAALGQLGRESFHELDSADREIIEIIRASARTALDTREKEATYECLLRDGAPLAACEVAELLLARAGESERAQRQRQVEEAQAAARRAFGVWVSRTNGGVEGEGGAERTIELGAPLDLAGGGKNPLPWLDAEGRSLILLERRDRWIFLEEVDLSVGRVCRRIVLQTPVRLAEVTATSFPAGNFVIADDGGRVLELSRENWQPLSWRSIRDPKVGEVTCEAKLAPGGRHVWVHIRRNFEDPIGVVHAVDLERRHAARTVSDGWWFRPLFGPGEPMMALLRRGLVLSLHDPGGAAVDGGTFPLPGMIDEVLVHPGRGRLLVFIVEGASEGKQCLWLVEFDADGRSSQPRYLEDLSLSRPRVCATALAQHTSFLVVHDQNDAAWLHALGTTSDHGPIETLYRVPLPAGTSLALDPLSRHVVALVLDGERLHAVPLGSEVPQLPACRSQVDRRGVEVLECRCANYHAKAHLLEPAGELQGMPTRAAMAWMERQIVEVGADSPGLASVFYALQISNHSAVAEALLRRIAEKVPSDPHLALLEAELYVNHRRWGEVRQRLDGVDLRGLAVERRQHAHHILGLALLEGGEVERAIAAFEEGLKVGQGTCQLAPLLALFGPRPPEGDDADVLRELRAAIDDTDGRLLRDEPARAAIDRPIVWNSREVQSLARLAEMELSVEPEDDAGKFRKALALARFLDAHRAVAVARRELILPGASWSSERLADVEVRAQGWLDRLGGREESRAAAPSAAEASPPAAEAPPAAVAESGEGEILPNTVEGGESPSVIAPASEGSPPAWALAFQELDDAIRSIAAESPSASGRLAFRIHHAERRFEGIDVLLQRALRHGRFSVGQVVDAGDLLAAPESLIDEADASAVVVVTEGAQPTTRSRPSSSRARMLRLLGALVGHPRVFLHERPSEAAEVRLGELAVEVVQTAEGLELRFLVGGARWTADELLAHVDVSLAVDVDAEARRITMVRLGSEALALIRVLEQHRPIFPPDRRDELLRRLDAFQYVIDLRLPLALAGEIHEADCRPVVRLTPVDEAGLLVEIGVRPVPGALFGPPGVGSQVALGAVGGLRVSARRDLARERAAAEQVSNLGALVAAARRGRWRWEIVGEEKILALVEELAECGAEIIVEWPRDAGLWRRMGKATLETLRVRVDHRGDLLRIQGEVEIDGHRIALAVLLEAIAQGRRYVMVGPRMFVSLAADLRARLETVRELIFGGRNGLEAGLGAAPELAEMTDETTAPHAAWRALRARTLAARTLEPELPAGLRAQLRDYQREGFRWLARLSGWAAGACLADDMGLGKTLQTLALLLHRAELGPALVIAPVSVTSGWISESARFAPALRVQPYRGGQRSGLLAGLRAGDVLVAGYGVVVRDADALAGVRFSTLVLDEAHMIKNSSTRRARAVGRIDADFRVALTGTPVENHLGELWSLFRVISPGLLGTWPQFRERFAAPIERDHSVERRVTLGRVLRPFLLRRTKEAVLPELPPLIELDRLVALTAAEREFYETARLAAANAISEVTTASERFAVLGWLTRLRRLSCHPRLVHEAWTGPSSKLSALLALVEDLREAGHRALVFSQFTDHLALVQEALKARRITFLYLDGTMSVDERHRSVEEFQRGAGDLFLISLKAGGTGLNLTAADHVIHLDPWWNPAVEDQATDRAHRIGQARPVTVIRLIAQGTIEEAVLALHADKRALAEGLLDGSDAVARMSANELLELVRRGTSAGDTGGLDEEVDDESETGGDGKSEVPKNW